MAYSNYYNGYQPYMTGAAQPQLPDMVNSVNAQRAMQTGYLCRPVMSREEAVAAEVNYFSPGTLMPDLIHEVVYLKRFNPNTGSSDFMTFVFKADEPEVKVEYASTEEVLQLRQTIDDLRAEVESLKKPVEPRRYVPKGVRSDDAE